MGDLTAERPGSPPLNRADAWLLAALTESSREGRPVTLRELVHDADWLNRSIPTFDELSFGLPRLMTAGFLTVHQDAATGVRFEATPKATRLRSSVKGKTLGDTLMGMEQAVGAVVYPAAEPPEDRSLGPLPGLQPEDLGAAVQAHGEWVERWSKPFVVAGRLLTKWQNRKS